MDAGYVGKYGPALRQLQALEAASQGLPVGPMGPQPVTAPFQPPQRYANEPAAPAFQQAGEPPVQGGALTQLPEVEVKGKKPQSVTDIVSSLPLEERRELRKGIKEKTGKTVDELYEQFVKSGEIAPPAERKPKAKERLSVVAEAMFRYLAHVNKMGVAGAVGQATLETQGRRGALEQAEIDEENARAEARRGEVQGVLSARNTRAQARQDKVEDRGWEAEQARQKFVDEKALRDADNAAALGRVREQQKGDNTQVVFDADGNAIEITKGSAVGRPVMVESEEPALIGLGAFKTPKPGGKRKVQRPLKGVPGGMTGATTLDPDTVYNRRAEMIQAITEDKRRMRALQKRANDEGRDVSELINEEVDKLLRAGGTAALGGPSGKVIDFSELPD